MKGKVEPDSEETWSLLQFWIDLLPLLGGDAQVHAAIVAMHIPLLGAHGVLRPLLLLVMELTIGDKVSTSGRLGFKFL